MITTIDKIFEILGQMWALVISSWILSYGVLISLLALIITIHNAKKE